MKVSRAKRLDHDALSKALSQTLCGLCGGGLREHKALSPMGQELESRARSFCDTNGELLRKAKYIRRTFESIAVRIQMRSSGGQVKETVNSGPATMAPFF
ncbi:hypothetical protein PAAG_02240 [Paracoccidioides lutzii Pb01]|uniref:Uncharacterized protein n=1 Tax=Paracoccidioides lutzii (strain ATCC MYA-826 / Pb01) TaxID=502779 RepID=C1GVG3_PARBA|nr:hypothetical protein PAAG_02240 [Paracoccidioides lutzii Pb01]EEH40185.2 hypothetical protein PAAG_02240 [Paracoccidioides lutzii Pb01]